MCTHLSSVFTLNPKKKAGPLLQEEINLSIMQKNNFETIKLSKATYKTNEEWSFLEFLSFAIIQKNMIRVLNKN